MEQYSTLNTEHQFGKKITIFLHKINQTSETMEKQHKKILSYSQQIDRLTSSIILPQAQQSTD
jgi:hypothetical protein